MSRNPTRDVYTDGNVSVQTISGDAYIVCSLSLSKGPVLSIDKIEGNLYLLGLGHLEQILGKSVRERGTLLQGAEDASTMTIGGKLLSQGCSSIICVQQSFSACNIGHVAGDFIPINNLLPSSLAIRHFGSGSFLGTGAELPAGSMLALCAAWKSFGRRRAQASSYQLNAATPNAPQLPRIEPATSCSNGNGIFKDLSSEANKPGPSSFSLLQPAPTLNGSERRDEAVLQPLRSSPGPRPDQTSQWKSGQFCIPLLPHRPAIKPPGNWDCDPKSISCANCSMVGHQLRECIGPIDSNGWIHGCPLCNTKNHAFEHCVFRKSLEKDDKRHVAFEVLLRWRLNKPPIHTSVELYEGKGSSVPYISQHVACAYPAAASLEFFQERWKNFDYALFYGQPDRNGALLPPPQPTSSRYPKRKATQAQAQAPAQPNQPKQKKGKKQPKRKAARGQLPAQPAKKKQKMANRQQGPTQKSTLDGML